MNLNISILKTDKLSAFLKPGPNFFSSMIADGKKEPFKKLWFILKRGMFNTILADYNERLAGIKLKDIEDCHYLKQRQSFLYQRQTRKDSKLSSCKNIGEVSWMSHNVSFCSFL